MRGSRILVCAPQTPFVRGGSEVLVEQLVSSLRAQEYKTDVVSLPFQDWPHEALIRSASIWRMLDLDKLYLPADAVIATKFPSYYVQHPNKIVWLFHNYRQIYDLYDTPYGGYSRRRTDDLQASQWIAVNDREFLLESQKILAISENVRNRLRKYLDLDAEVLYPPPPMQDRFHCKDYEPFIFVAQRLDPYKRTDLLLQSVELVEGDFKVLIAGTGPDETRLRDFVCEKGMENRVQFLGRITDEELIDYYARCRMVYYAPFDEDYGFTTVEAFLSHKPVLTASDSGGALEFVEHKTNGWIASPLPGEMAAGIREIIEQPDYAGRLGEEGYRKVRNLSWASTMARFQQIFTELHL